MGWGSPSAFPLCNGMNGLISGKVAMVIVPTPLSSNVGWGEERTASFARTHRVTQPMRFVALSTSYVRGVAMAETLTNASKVTQRWGSGNPEGHAIAGYWGLA
jgi:hypothetical protein